MGPLRFVIPAVVGGAIVGPIVHFLAREVKGHGVPQVMEAVALRGGRIRPRVAVVQAIASSICIGSGGSAGREAPIVQIGSTLGSTLGQLLHLKNSQLTSLVACGAAGGIAATFNAPLAGAFFALEVLQREFSAGAFGLVVLASVSASVVGRSVFGENAAFPVPQYGLASFSELPLFVVLGLVAAVVGVGYAGLVYWMENRFDRIHMPEYTKAALGGLLLGLLATLTILGGAGAVDGIPGIMGVGYGAITKALLLAVPLWVPVVWLFTKPLATALTLGSGGSGGVFAPSLVIGSMLGVVFGQVVHLVAPGLTTSPGGYALVGMGALFAAAAHAPITAVLVIFEITGDYRIILPLMTACVVATVVARRLRSDSIYTLKLTQQGVHITLRQDISLMNSLRVEEAMAPAPLTVPYGMSINAAMRLFETTKHHGFPLVDDQGHLRGMLTLQDAREALVRDLGETPVEQVASRALYVAYPDETLGDALQKLSLGNVGRLPVVDRKDTRKLLGLITRKNLLAAYREALRARHTRLEPKYRARLD